MAARALSSAVTLTLAVLGDSIAYGQGASSPDRFHPSSAGYAVIATALSPAVHAAAAAALPARPGSAAPAGRKGRMDEPSRPGDAIR